MTHAVLPATTSRTFGLVALAFACALFLLAGTGCEDKAAVQTTLQGARAAYDKGDFAASADELAALIEDNAQNYEARRLYALVLAAQGENDKAIEQFEAVIEAAPEDDESLYRLALIERLTGKTEDAVRHLEQAVEVKADDSYVDELARTYMQIGKFEEAAAAWGSLLENEKRELESKVEILKLQAEAFQAAKDYEAARKALEQAIELAPNDGELKQKLEALS